MRFQKFSFGSIRIDGTTYEHDVVIDRGEVRKRKKRPSKKFREAFGHTPISPKGSSCTKGHALRLGHATATNGICSEVQSIMYDTRVPALCTSVVLRQTPATRAVSTSSILVPWDTARLVGLTTARAEVVHKYGYGY